MTTGLFEINAPAVVSDIIDGEAVMINLDTGAYYSLNESGSLIWDRIRERGSLEALIGKLAESRQVDAAQVGDAVRKFVEQLKGENLIRPCATRRDFEAGTPSQPELAGPPAGTAPFVAPLLEKYRDLEDLLLADPIHDVSEAGWPHQNTR